MLGLVAGLSGLVAVLAALHWHSRSEAKAAHGRAAELEREILTVANLTRSMSTTDWQQSLEGVANGLVQGDICQAAVLLAVTEAGALESRAAAYASEEPYWDAGLKEAAMEAMGGKVPLRLGQHALLMPIRAEGEPLGVLAVHSVKGSDHVLGVAARLFAFGLAGLRHYQRQAALSNTDGLTGLATHRHFQQALGVALGQAYLEGEPLCLILLDIDHFKKVNDNYGHLLGDLVLREIAYLLRKGLPPDALVARYGGEEMAIILHRQSSVRAEEIAEAVRQKIAAHQVFDFSSGAQLQVTVSMGIAHYELGQGKNRLIARADEALYASKREGRNRVTIASIEDRSASLFPS
jgi:diguanylate cyclase (GGDEF)-like protein